MCALGDCNESIMISLNNLAAVLLDGLFQLDSNC